MSRPKCFPVDFSTNQNEETLITKSKFAGRSYKNIQTLLAKIKYRYISLFICFSIII